MNEIFIDLKHTVQEVETILRALSKMAYEDVYQLIGKVHAQAAPQHAAAIAKQQPQPVEPIPEPAPETPPASVEPLVGDGEGFTPTPTP